MKLMAGSIVYEMALSKDQLKTIIDALDYYANDDLTKETVFAETEAVAKYLLDEMNRSDKDR